VTHAPSLPQTCVAIAVPNPLLGPDNQIATWFHAHLSSSLVHLLRLFSEPGSAEWIAIVLLFAVLFFAWKRAWPSLVTLIIAVPGGMLLNELVKIVVHRGRPFVEGSFVDWSGYSFASGHTIGATLLYGQLLLFLWPVMKSRHWQKLAVGFAAMLVLLVGFSRIALGAHYLTDVLAAIVFGLLWLLLCGIGEKSLRRGTLAQREQAIVPAPTALPAEVALMPVMAESQPISDNGAALG